MPLHCARFSLACPAALLVLGGVGCSSGPPVESHRLIQHQALVDFSGLKAPEVAEAVRVQASTPASWSLHAVERRALYTHQQWKSASAKTAVGVIYARLPLPLGPDTLLWLGRQQYAKQGSDGRQIANWTDALGRRWFEAETDKYHTRGYAIVTGLDAWIVYMGYRIDTSPEPADISLGLRCMETFVPVKSGVTLPAAVPQSPPTDPATRPTAAEPATRASIPVPGTVARTGRAVVQHFRQTLGVRAGG